MAEPIEVGKYYLTRNGSKAGVYAIGVIVDGKSCIHGAILEERGWMLITWNGDGTLNGPSNPHHTDIISEWTEASSEPISFWSNVYRDSSELKVVGELVKTKEQALSNRRFNCIRTSMFVEVIDYESSRVSPELPCSKLSQVEGDIR